jgi:sigma-54 specific flagellar transcriptional regulator A
VTDAVHPAVQFPLQRAVHGMVGASSAMQRLFKKIDQYGPADAPVLVTGETGTGKELVARALHAVSPRRGSPWVALNCAAMNEDIFESELFGHERGSFTGAVAAHKGRFERADRGTLFLDEIGEMPLRLQAKLLRVLESGVYERVGGEEERLADARVVAATNVPLERAVRQKSFRADLFHRVAVLRIHMPPLRERPDDLPLLVDHFLRFFNGRYLKQIRRVTPEALRLLQAYPWPGNVRELRNVLERVYVETDGDVINAKAFAEWEREREVLAAGGWDLNLLDEQQLTGKTIIVPATSYGVAPAPADAPVVQALPLAPARPSRGPRKLTEERIREALTHAEGNFTHAAELLGCHKTTLYRALRRLGLDPAEFRG